VPNFAFVPPFGDLGVTYTVHLWLVGKRVVDFLLALMELLFSSSYGWGAMSKYWSKLRCLKGGKSLLSANFRGKGESSTNEFWRQKTRLPGLSCGVVCVIVRLAVLIQYRRVTQTQTDTQTRDHGYYPRRASSARVKTGHAYYEVVCHRKLNTWRIQSPHSLGYKNFQDFPGSQKHFPGPCRTGIRHRCLNMKTNSSYYGIRGRAPAASNFFRIHR